MLKKCSKCGVEKPLTEFHKHKSTKDKLRSACKLCIHAQNNVWKEQNPERYRTAIADWWRANPEKQKAKDKRRKENGYFERYAADPKNQEHRKEYSKQYRANNKDAIAKKGERWRKANPERARATKKAWRTPARQRVDNHKRRTRRHSAEGSHTAKEIEQLLIDQNYRCANPHCACDIKDAHASNGRLLRQLDHKVPLCRGGSNYIANLQWLCALCNNSKSRKTMDEWLLVKYG